MDTPCFFVLEAILLHYLLKFKSDEAVRNSIFSSYYSLDPYQDITYDFL
jgi:hypothetical protein